MTDFESESFVRKNAIWLVILAALVIFGFLLFKGWDKVVNNEIDSMMTISGNFSCLPLKTGTESPNTCTLGVRSRDGFYYALDVRRIQDANTDLKAEDTIAVTGTLEPDSKISTSDWAKYNIKGIVLVNTLLRTR